jgi:hypothetical protein
MQIPNAKHQVTNKPQITNAKSKKSKRSADELRACTGRGALVWTLVLAVWSLFEIWCFEFVSDFVLRV